MEDIRLQEILKHNRRLAETNTELKKEYESVRKALQEVALPALKEYQNFSPSSLANIARGAIKKILEIIK